MILTFEKWTLKIIKINNMKKVQNIIKKYNKMISTISFINNFTNFKFYNFSVLSSDFGCIQEKMIAIYLLHY